MPGWADPFPHIYGPLDVAAVVQAVPLERDAAGSFRWPAWPGRPVTDRPRLTAQGPAAGVRPPGALCDRLRRAARADVGQLVSLAQQRGWDVCVLTTPSGRRFTDPAALERQTGHPVRSEYKIPGEPDVLPDPDAVIVAPATVNTINEGVAGICDTLALGILVEAIGKRLPIVALPSTNQAHAAHPAFPENVGKLRSWGVSVLFGPGIDGPGSPGRAVRARPVPLVRDLDASSPRGPAGRTPQTAEPSTPGPGTRSEEQQCRGNPRGTSWSPGAAPASAGPSRPPSPTRATRSPLPDAAPPLDETAAVNGVAWVAFDASDPAAVSPPWTSCRRPWRSWSTMRAEHRLRPGGPDANDLGGLAAAWQANLDVGTCPSRPDGRGLPRASSPDARSSRSAHRGPPGCRLLRGGHGGRRGLDRRRRRGTGTARDTANVVSPGVTLGSSSSAAG